MMGAVKSPGLTRRRSRFTSLSRGHVRWRRAHREIGRPAVGQYLPCAGRLPHQHNQVLAAFFATLAHGYRNEHLASANVESDFTKQFESQRIHFYIAQSRFEKRNEKLPYRGQAANRRNARTNESRIGRVEFE